MLGEGRGKLRGGGVAVPRAGCVNYAVFLIPGLRRPIPAIHESEAPKDLCRAKAFPGKWISKKRPIVEEACALCLGLLGVCVDG